MKSFDDEGNMKFILEEIQKADTFYNSFKKEFSEIIFQIMQEFYPGTINNDEIENVLLAYSVAVLNSTESVIDKDRNYPFYRLEEELEAMNRITLNLSTSEENFVFVETIHAKAKELMVKYFASIYDLSSIGFRLLEKNAWLYSCEFVSNFQSISSSIHQTTEQ
jgi:hypothetical protein